jgi:hypothetical protein
MYDSGVPRREIAGLYPAGGRPRLPLPGAMNCVFTRDELRALRGMMGISWVRALRIIDLRPTLPICCQP